MYQSSPLSLVLSLNVSTGIMSGRLSSQIRSAKLITAEDTSGVPSDGELGIRKASTKPSQSYQLWRINLSGISVDDPSKTCHQTGCTGWHYKSGSVCGSYVHDCVCHDP